MATRMGIAEFQAVLEHALEDRSRECCGFILHKTEDPGWRQVRAENIHPNPASHFIISPASMSEMATIRKDGYRVAYVYHSHVLPGSISALSSEDRVRLVFRGKPLFPDASPLVIAFPDPNETVFESCAFRWNDERMDYELSGTCVGMCDQGRAIIEQPEDFALVEKVHDATAG